MFLLVARLPNTTTILYHAIGASRETVSVVVVVCPLAREGESCAPPRTITPLHVRVNRVVL